MSRLLLLSIVLLSAVAPSTPKPLPVMTPETWRLDVDFFARQLPERHVAPFHAVSKERFDAAVAELREQVEKGNAETIVGLMKLAAMIGDRQTRVHLPSGAHRLPIVVGLFGGEYRVVRSADWTRAVLGGRIVRIHDTPIEEVERRLRRVVPRDENEAFVRAQLPTQIVVAEVLVGLGIAPDAAYVPITVALPEGEKTVKLPTVPVAINPRTWVWATDASPLSSQNASDPMSFTYIEASRAVYVNFRSYDGLAPRSKALWSLVDAKRPARIVIDLRDNTGDGDPREGRSRLVDELEKREGVKGYVLLGNRTSAAAVENAIELRDIALARLVGEAPGGRPNGYHAPATMVLPYSRLVVSYATYREERARKGSSSAQPAKVIEPTWEDYLAGRDPALAWALQR